MDVGQCPSYGKRRFGVSVEGVGFFKKMARPERFERPTLRFVASGLHFRNMHSTMKMQGNLGS